MEIKDVTDKYQFKNLELRFKALDVGLWYYDIDSGNFGCDEKWYDLIGREYNSITSLDAFRAYIHPEDAALATHIDFTEVNDLIAQDERYSVDFRIIRPDGEIRWWRSVAYLEIDPETGHRRAIGCVTDNTEFRLLDSNLTRDAADHSQPAEAMDEAARTPDEVVRRDGLSAREVECLRWVSVGKTAWETAIIMGRSQRTVEFHLLNAVRKLSASNKIHAAVIAVRRGLI